MRSVPSELRQSIIAFLLILLFAARQGDAAVKSSVATLDSPNHYIVLVDASGSTKKDDRTRAAFSQAGRLLARKLYRERLGAIPSVRPGTDYVSLYYFGIVRGDAATAWKRLGHCDFSNEYLHKAVSASKTTSEWWLIKHLVSEPSYNYSLCSWARQLGLWKVGSVVNGCLVGHTYIIVLTDAVPNGGSVWDEAIQVEERCNAQNVKWLRNVFHTMNQNYYLGRPDRTPGLSFIWKHHVGDGGAIFIEAFEAFSINRNDAERSALSVNPIDPARHPTFLWTKDTAKNPEGQLRLWFSPEFRRFVSSSQQCVLQVQYKSEGQAWDSTQGLDDAAFIPVSFDGKAQPGTPGWLTITAKRLESDKLLGIRPAQYTWTMEYPITNREPWHQRIWPVVLVLTAMAGCGWFVYNLFFVNHIHYTLPGLGGFRPLKQAKTGHILFQKPDWRYAFSTVELPSTATQAIFCRGDKLVLQSQTGTLVWRELGEAEAHLPLGVTTLTAVWDGDEPTEVMQEYSLRYIRKILGGSKELNMTYNKMTDGDTAIVPHCDNNAERRNPQVVVALDLGSESIAACVGVTKTGKQFMIQMQRDAEKLVGYELGTSYGINPDLLMEVDRRGGQNDGWQRSPRMRTRLGIRRDVLKKLQSDNDFELLHSKIGVFDDNGNVYKEKCVFRYFFDKGQLFQHQPDWMPNPKIIYMAGMGEANSLVDGNAKVLLNHQIAQILRNFVLNSSEYRKAKEGVDDRDVQLVVTVPNVYSVSHVTGIVDFLKSEFPQFCGQITHLYESDAVAHFAMEQSKVTWRGSAFADWQNACNNDVYIATIDVGKGTTDLSLIMRRPPEAGNGRRPQCTVLGRTGIASGGNKLDYIYAAYYENCVRRVFQQYGSRLLTSYDDAESPLAVEQINGEKRAVLNEPPFSFLRQRSYNGISSLEAFALVKLRDLILEIKTNSNEDMSVSLSYDDQRKLISPIANAIVGYIDETFIPQTIQGMLDPSGNLSADHAGLAVLRELLINAMYIPEKKTTKRNRFQTLWDILLPPRVEPQNCEVDSSELEKLLSAISESTNQSQEVTVYGDARAAGEHSQPTIQVEDLCRREDWANILLQSKPSSRSLRDLHEKIALYLKVTISETVEDLMRMAPSNFNANGCFAVVAGQAAQFAPMHKQIKAALYKCGFGSRIGHLTGPMAKESCCKGAVRRALSPPDVRDESKLFGEYGFATTEEPARYIGLGQEEMSCLNQGELVTKSLPEDRHWLLVYSPKIRIQDRPEDLIYVSKLPDDGRSAVLHGFNADGVDLKFDVSELKIQMTTNGVETTVEPGTYNQIPGYVWPNVWPEILPTREKYEAFCQIEESRGGC